MHVLDIIWDWAQPLLILWLVARTILLRWALSDAWEEIANLKAQLTAAHRRLDGLGPRRLPEE